MRGRRFMRLASALALVLSACSQTTVGTEPTAAGPEDWGPVDNPLVEAARASQSLDPVARAFDGSDETSWVSGFDAPQWIEFDLGEPLQVAAIRLLVDQFPDGFTVHEITAGAHDVPGMLITTLEGETQIGQWLEVSIDKEVQFIRITTTESPSWIAWGEIEVVPAS